MLYPPVGVMNDKKLANMFMRLVFKDLRKKIPFIDDVRLDC
jgi:hypothetical protein